MSPLKYKVSGIAVILFILISTTADAGLFRRCRHRHSRCDCPPTSQAAPAPAPPSNCTNGMICLNYSYANHASFCSYYATICDGVGGSSPTNWSDLCFQPLGGCNNCPSAGCKDRSFARQKTCDGQLISNELGKDGMKGVKPKPADLTRLDVSAKPKKKEGTLVKVNSAGGTLIVCQLWEVDVDPDKHVPKQPHPPKEFFIGHEVDAEPAAGLEMIKDADRKWDAHVCCLKFKGKSYSVISHMSTK